jgi:hypothetical protein
MATRCRHTRSPLCSLIAAVVLILRPDHSSSATAAASAAPWWQSGVISHWYAPDNDWPAAVDIVKAHAPLVTSLMSYCGIDVADNGTMIIAFHDTCVGLFAALKGLGVRAELATGSGNCSIDTFRALWRDTTDSPVALRDAVLSVGADGLNVDFEPQADNCQGGPTGDASDAALFATWLGAVRAQLSPHGVRLTVDVASWSPVLSEYATLAAGVDRVLTMETYNGDNPGQWDGYLSAFVGATPLDKAGVGLGAWSDGTSGWWESSAAAQHKVNASLAAKVPELAVFRIVPSPEVSPEWPLAFWWPALSAFKP